MAEEILTSLRRTNSENFGAGEGHHELTDASVKYDVPEDFELTKAESIKDKNTTSRWASLTRIFRLGLAAAGHGADLPDISSSQVEQLTTHSKRGSLGKFFRHGFGHSVPATLNESDINSPADLKDDVQLQNKRGSLARFFKQSRPVDLEGNHIKGSEDHEVCGERRETRKQQLGKIWKQRFGGDRRKSGTEDILPNTEPLYNTGPSVSNHEQKRMSLGKMFRLKQNSSTSKEVSHT
ncbi:uncharacterized protein LOC126354733 [Schistocerca gregaria]|uniref:uncharacterized protein LOC126354733 n=1 Tax=Schistocerca gregaria TaxID=7010 RepID=UPI00211F37C1|nr:uncharacterized protein LOC126354733 [Schistocerca gregaria]XP_049860556.1 uncharacterized protein LOC126354733 [Schistocerca gregaria]